MTENNSCAATGGADRARAAGSVLSLLSGPFFAPAVAAIWAGRREGEYVAAPDARRHLWHAWLAAPGALRETWSAPAADDAHARLTFTRGRTLMEEAWGGCPPGLLNALGRLGPLARPPEVYRALTEILACGGGPAQLVLHGKALADQQLLALASVPARADDVALAIGALAEADASEISTFAWALERARRCLGPTAVAGALAAKEPWRALWEAASVRDFPAPPWPATQRLIPLDGVRRLRAAGERFRNCLGSDSHRDERLSMILSGLAYVYEWTGPEPALLEFRRFLRLGWRLCCARGQENSDLPDETRIEIASELSGLEGLMPVEANSHAFWPMGFEEIVVVDREG